MSNPKGNPGNKGNRNATGRPSIKETEWHLAKWEEDSLVEELEQKILSKKYAIRDMWLLMALKGNDKIIRQAADKVLADLHDITSARKPIHSNPEELQELAIELKKIIKGRYDL
jgi:hypothetical protein